MEPLSLAGRGRLLRGLRRITGSGDSAKKLEIVTTNLSCSHWTRKLLKILLMP